MSVPENQRAARIAIEQYVTTVAQLLGYESAGDLPKGAEMLIRSARGLGKTTQAASEQVRKALK